MIRPRRQVLNPDQMPLIVPDSKWVRPTELPDLRRVKEFALDTEEKDDGLANERGPGWVYGAGHVAGISVAWHEGQNVRSAYVPVRHPDSDNFDHDAVTRWLRDITAKPKVIFQNAPYDIGWLNQDFGMPVPSQIDDVGCMAIMIDETQNGYSLDEIAERLGIPGKDETLLREAAHVYGFNPKIEKEVKRAIAHMPARYAGIYAEQDAVATLMSAHEQRPEIAAQGLLRAYQLEMDLIPLIHAMRKRGIRMDMDLIQSNMDRLYGMRDEALRELRRLTGYGRDIVMDDVRQQKWLVDMFNVHGVEYDHDEKENKSSFKKDWMRQGYLGRYEEGRQGHWLPLLVARAKQCHEAADKFLRGYLLEFAHRGRIHANINQFLTDDGGTRTFRFSYSGPPLQQMPSRGEQLIRNWNLTMEIVKMIRVCFLPERGEKWCSPDYSQQEFRLTVDFAHRLGLTKADWAAQMYLDDPDTDFHNLVVEMTGLMRQRAKDVNFAKSYGAGLDKFCIMTGMTKEEGAKTIEQYDTQMPFVSELNKRCDKAAQRRGYIVMIDGARMHFNSWECAKWIDFDVKRAAAFQGFKTTPCSLVEARDRVATRGHPWFGKPLRRADTRKAMNSLIQGSAARQGKMAMRDMWRAGYVPLVQVHDEFPNSVGREKDGRIIGQIMRDAYKSTVPFKVDVEYGANWGDAKHCWKDARTAA